MIPAKEKELLKKSGAFLRLHLSLDLAAMIELGHLQDVQEAAGGASLGIVTPEDDSAETRMNDRARTHRTRFFGHKELTVAQSPIPHRTRGLGNCKHLGMRGCILKRLHLVPRATHYFAIPDDNGAHRNLVTCESLAGLAQCLSHEKLIAGEIHTRTL